MLKKVTEKRIINTKFLKNKTTLGIFSIIVGILVCFIFAPLYNKSLEAKIQVVRVENRIEKGQKIESRDIKLVEIGGYNLPEKIIRTLDAVVGSYAITDMFPGELLIPEKLSNHSIHQEYLQSLDGEEGAISITLPSFATGLSGKLLAGDIVSIYRTNTTSYQTELPKELIYVKVLAVTTSKGHDVDENTINGEAEEKLPNTVTLLVSDKQAKVLASAEVSDKIHIKLVHRGTVKEAETFLESQRTILEKLELEMVEEERIEESIESKEEDNATIEEEEEDDAE